MDIKCKSCGYELFPTDKICDRCGTPVPVVVPPAPAPKQKISRFSKPEKPSKPAKSNIAPVSSSKGGTKCPNCGANIGASNTCEFCGASITYNMKREREQLNKVGCPKCGSSNISFTREKQGEYKGKNGSTVIRSTVGLCGDCGHTWKTNGINSEPPKKNNLVWWILGWIFIFPIPLTILIWRKKNTWPLAVKILLTVLLWGWILLMPATGSSEKEEEVTETEQVVEEAPEEVAEEPPVEEPEEEIAEEISEENNSSGIILEYGVIGEYGFESTLNAGTDSEEKLIVYHVPAGKYLVKNIGEHPGQISVYSDETHFTEEGFEEPAVTGDVAVIEPNDSTELSIEDGFYIEIQENDKFELVEITEENTESVTEKTQEAHEEDPADDFTMSQKQAIKSGQKYLDYTAFSKKGLIQQLSSEYGDNFSKDDATYAVEYLEENGMVDWKEQAIKAGEKYLDYSAFSKKGLIQQLSSEAGDQYTQDEAEYAVQYIEDNGLVDWNEQAAKAAKKYLDFTSFSREGLIEQLTSDAGDQYTKEQAEYGVAQVGF